MKIELCLRCRAQVSFGQEPITNCRSCKVIDPPKPQTLPNKLIDEAGETVKKMIAEHALFLARKDQCDVLLEQHVCAAIREIFFDNPHQPNNNASRIMQQLADLVI